MALAGVLLHVILLTMCMANIEATPENNNNETVYKLQVVTHPMEPFFYYTSYDRFPRGIITVILNMAKNKCSSHKFVESFIDLKNRSNFIKTIHNPAENQYGKGLLANVTEQSQVIWFPYDFDLKLTPHNGNFWMERRIEYFTLLKSEEVVIVLPQNLIYLPLKVLRGIENCSVIFIFGILIGLIVGILFWIVERPFNDQLNNPATGAGIAIYWSFVTMTTVGYGDVTPKTFFGRAIAIFWMFLGIIIASILTATLSQFVSGTEGLEIYGQKVAVLESSYEQDVIEHDYKGKVVTFANYEDVVNALRRGEVFAAALPYDVAANMKDSIVNSTKENVLSYVYSLPGRAKFGMFVSNEFAKTELFKCLFDENMVKEATTFFEKHIHFETVFYGELAAELTKASAFHVLYGMLCGVVLIGAMLAYFFPKRQHNKSNAEVEQFVSVERKIDEKIGELSKLIDKLNHIKKSNKDSSIEGQKSCKGEEFIF